MQYIDFKLCPVCSSNNIKKISRVKKETGYFKKKIFVTLRICQNCSFVFQSPRILKSYLDRYYKKSNNASGKTFFLENKRNYKYGLNYRRFDFLKANTNYVNKKKISIIEIGSSSNVFLNLFNDKRFDLNAVEPSKQKKIKTIKQYNEVFEKIKFKKRFDIIASFHTLEHIYDINIFLQKISEIITPNGVLFIEVPNGLKMGFLTIEDYYPFEHMSYFNAENLKIILRKYKFGSFVIDNKDNTNLRILAKFNNEEKKFALRKKIINKNIDTFIDNYQEYQKKNDFFRKVIINRLTNIIEKYKKEKKIIAIYGAGVHTHHLFSLMKVASHAKYIFDSNINKKGSYFKDYQIKHVKEITKYKIDAIVISSVNFEDEIYNSLKKINLNKKIKIIKIYDFLKIKKI